jgi:hypothetical protein
MSHVSCHHHHHPVITFSVFHILHPLVHICMYKCAFHIPHHRISAFHKKSMRRPAVSSFPVLTLHSSRRFEKNPEGIHYSLRQERRLRGQGYSSPKLVTWKSVELYGRQRRVNAVSGRPRCSEPPIPLVPYSAHILTLNSASRNRTSGVEESLAVLVGGKGLEGSRSVVAGW